MLALCFRAHGIVNFYSSTCGHSLPQMGSYLNITKHLIGNTRRCMIRVSGIERAPSHLFEGCTIAPVVPFVSHNPLSVWEPLAEARLFTKTQPVCSRNRTNRGARFLHASAYNRLHRAIDAKKRPPRCGQSTRDSASFGVTHPLWRIPWREARRVHSRQLNGRRRHLPGRYHP